LTIDDVNELVLAEGFYNSFWNYLPDGATHYIFRQIFHENEQGACC